MARTPGKSRNYRERRGRWTVLVTRPSTIFLPPRHTTFTAFGASTQATATDAGHRAHVVATTFQATIEAAVVLVYATIAFAGGLNLVSGMRPTDLDGSCRGHASKEAECGECNGHD